MTEDEFLDQATRHFLRQGFIDEVKGILESITGDEGAHPDNQEPLQTAARQFAEGTDLDPGLIDSFAMGVIMGFLAKERMLLNELMNEMVNDQSATPGPTPGPPPAT